MPGARVVVAHAGQIVVDHTVGTLDGTHPTTPDAVYDLASITKVAATGNALMHMAGFGLLEEDGQVHDLLPELKGHPLGTRSHANSEPPSRPGVMDPLLSERP